MGSAHFIWLTVFRQICLNSSDACMINEGTKFLDTG